MSRETFYSEQFALVPMDFYVPGAEKREDLPPRKEFAAKWHLQLIKDMPNLHLFIPIGHYADASYLSRGRGSTLNKTVQNYRQYLPQYFPLVHPSPRNIGWQLKNPWLAEEVVTVLRETISGIVRA